MIRVESEVTQDYVRESLNLSRDEADDKCFVSSAISIPQRPMFRCDNRCSDKAFRFWQFASVVVEDGKESHTANYNESLTAKGLALLKNWQWKAVVEKKAHRGRLRRMLGKDQYIQGMWEFFSLERVKAKKFMKNAKEEKQEGMQGQWQRESPAKEYLEQVKSCAETDCTPKMMKYWYFALKGGDWKEYKSIFMVETRATEWAFETKREAFEKVAKDEAGRLNIVQGSLLKSTDFLRRIIAPA